MVQMAAMKAVLVAVVGEPNAGKSTLLNAMVGEKVGIVSSKPNTTRVVVRGVVTEGEVQIVLMDTPGLNTSSKVFERRLVQQARGALAEADVALLVWEFPVVRGREKGVGKVVDSRAGEQLRTRVEELKAQGARTVVVGLSKIDRVKDKKALLPFLAEIATWQKELGVAAVVPLFAPKGDGVKALVGELKRLAVAGPWLFPAGQATDMPLPLRLAELTREQAMQLLEQELPYSVGVVTVLIEQNDDAPWLVRQEVLVSKEQHKPMVLGAGGQMIKQIGMRARKEMQGIVGAGVRLELNVGVEARWLEREELWREMGY